MTSAGNKKTIGSRLAGFGRGIGAASLGLTLSLGLIGCATGTPPGEEVATAHLLALDTYEAQLGAPIGVFGTGFPTADEGKAYLVFDGVWNADDGSQAQVYEEFLLKRVDEGSARWDSFGPYKIPFGSGDRTGTFTGKVSTEIHSRDGSIVARDPEPKDMTFKVLPSIIVHELQPITAHCPTQIERGIGGLPYRMRVEAVGFEPETFTYSIETPALDRAGRSVRRLATGRFDTFGDDGTFVLPQVPDDDSFYAAIFVVQATDAQGRTYTNNFALGVRRPLEVYYNGGVEVVEYFAPDPQTACIPGGPTGRDYQWNNTKEETATRGYNLVWQENWNTSHTVTQGQSRTVGASVVNGIGFGTSDSANFSWGTNSEVNGEIGIDMLVKAGIGGRRGYLRNNGGESGSSTNQTRTEGVDVSETTTETESVAQEEGGGMEQEFSNQVSSSTSIGNTFGGQIVANTYGVVYTQKARLNRPALLIAYDQCGHSTVAADVNFTDWTWAIDLANGTQCDPLPASNLHKAQCFDDQCTENR